MEVIVMLGLIVLWILMVYWLLPRPHGPAER
jgi:hypothetical protein